MNRVDGDGRSDSVARARAELERKTASGPERKAKEPSKGAPVDRMDRTPSDLELLSQVFGAPRVTSAAPTASRTVAVERLSWARSAEAVLGTRLGKVPGALWTLQGKAQALRQALVDGGGGQARGQLGLFARVSMQQAAGRLETVAYRLGLAAELSRVRGESRSTLRTLVAAREALSAVHGDAEAALESLVRPSVSGVMQAVAEIRELARQARANESELRATYGQGVVLEQAIAAAGLAPEAAVAPALTEIDLQRLGSALDPAHPPPQTVWTEGMVNLVCERGRQQGGVSDADGARHYELARSVLSARVGGPAHELSPAELAAVLAQAGLALEKVDPNQLVSAARYVSSATSLVEQQDKLRKTLDTFQVLSSTGVPRMSRQEMVEELWAMAKVKGHALQKLSDAEVHKKLQEVAGALSGGPGPSEIKVGQHKLKLEIGEGGQILGSSCKKPGFGSKLWSGVKKVAAGRTMQGVASARSGNLLGGLASIGSGVAGGIRTFAGDMSRGPGKVADRLGHYSNRLSAVAAGTQAARSYQVARQAVGEARRALAAAQTSGDRRAVAEAQRQLTHVERQRRASLLGAAGGAFEAASLWVGDKASFPDHAKNPAAVSSLGVAANLDVARHPEGTTLGDASRLADADFGAGASLLDSDQGPAR